MKGFRIIFKGIKRLEARQFLRLLSLLATHPLFSIQTFIATLKTFKISEKNFPKTHHHNGRGNAFRHSLWCCLIMMYCCKISSPQKSLKWCKKITDTHEELFISEELLREMDLHNNQIGMDLFMRMLQGIHRQFFETSFFIDELYLLSQNAKFISSIQEIEKGRMVIIEDID